MPEFITHAAVALLVVELAALAAAALVAARRRVHPRYRPFDGASILGAVLAASSLDETKAIDEVADPSGTAADLVAEFVGTANVHEAAGQLPAAAVARFNDLVRQAGPRAYAGVITDCYREEFTASELKTLAAAFTAVRNYEQRKARAAYAADRQIAKVTAGLWDEACRVAGTAGCRTAAFPTPAARRPANNRRP